MLDAMFLHAFQYLFIEKEKFLRLNFQFESLLTKKRRRAHNFYFTIMVSFDFRNFIAKTTTKKICVRERNRDSLRKFVWELSDRKSEAA